MQFRLDVSETWCVILVNRSCYILFKNYRALYREATNGKNVVSLFVIIIVKREKI